MRKDSGALTVALCNTPDSPLMQLVDVAVPLHAGRESSVAATKSYIASLSCLAQLVASWTQDHDLLAALPRLPDAAGARLGMRLERGRRPCATP